MTLITVPSGVVGFTRTYGKHLPAENITLNAICPNIVQTGISSAEFYNKVIERGLLTPIENVVAAVESFLGDDKRSGECIEVGPKGTRATNQLEPMDEETRISMEMLHERARPLQEARS
jgi:NAD(P)-dependent dehydrogenase (short-subunit alcohol dehydrogenase family)